MMSRSSGEQFVPLRVPGERPLGDGANEQFKQLGVHRSMIASRPTPRKMLDRCATPGVLPTNREVRRLTTAFQRFVLVSAGFGLQLCANMGTT